MRRSLVAALVLLAGGALAGCSTTVSGDDVEEQISTELGKQLGEAPDDVSCPGDLDGEVGEKMTCTMRVAEEEFDVEVEVTSVEDGEVRFDMKVVE